MQTVHGIKVVYTKEAETADTYIERAPYELRRERRVRVATSDGPEQVIILGHGALRVSARAFHAAVEAAEGQISAVLQRLTTRPRSERLKQYQKARAVFSGAGLARDSGSFLAFIFVKVPDFLWNSNFSCHFPVFMPCC